MDVIVIGGGMGGLSAAIGLAARGARVTLLEKNARVGGKLNIWEQDGFTFDTGPHVLTMLWALDEVFAAAGRRLRRLRPAGAAGHGLPLSFSRQAATILDAPADPDAAARGHCPPSRRARRRASGAFSPTRGRSRRRRRSRFCEQDFGASVRGIPTPDQWGQLGEFLALKPWRTLRDVVRECFSDPRLRQIFELYALYSGSHPARCSGIFATVADVQWRQGTYYVQGGLYRLAEALPKIAQDLGVNISTQLSVSGDHRQRRAGAGRGDGRRASGCLPTPSSATPTASPRSRRSLPPRPRRRWTDRRVDAIEPSTSAFLLLLGVRGTYPQLAHHNSFLADDGDAEFADIFDQHRPADDPTIGVACQTVTDPTKAPPGCSNLFVMTNPPALSERFRLAARKPRAYRELVLAKLEADGADGSARAHSRGADVDAAGSAGALRRAPGRDLRAVVQWLAAGLPAPAPGLAGRAGPVLRRRQHPPRRRPPPLRAVGDQCRPARLGRRRRVG